MPSGSFGSGNQKTTIYFNVFGCFTHKLRIWQKAVAFEVAAAEKVGAFSCSNILFSKHGSIWSHQQDFGHSSLANCCKWESSLHKPSALVADSVAANRWAYFISSINLATLDSQAARRKSGGRSSSSLPRHPCLWVDDARCKGHLAKEPLSISFTSDPFYLSLYFGGLNLKNMTLAKSPNSHAAQSWFEPLRPTSLYLVKPVTVAGGGSAVSPKSHSQPDQARAAPGNKHRRRDQSSSPVGLIATRSKGAHVFTRAPPIFRWGWTSGVLGTFHEGN